MRDSNNQHMPPKADGLRKLREQVMEEFPPRVLPRLQPVTDGIGLSQWTPITQ